MQLFTLNRLVPSIWLKRQCLEGYFHGKVKNNALSIKNGRATPKRSSVYIFIRKLTKCGHLEVKTFHPVSLILSL
jgi:hypothetical protein